MSISEKICYSTVRIDCIQDNNTRSTGTGFFFDFSMDKGLCIPCIVTNKHVVEKASKAKFVLTCILKQTGITHHETITITDFEKSWLGHPTADLAIIPIAVIINILKNKGKELYYVSISEELIPTPTQLDELTAIEDIIMVGYPDGLWDSFNNKPIMRKGITATHPKLDFNNEKKFLIDAACFPGSSGSPIFILNKGIFNGEKCGINIGKRIYFLGILYAGTLHMVDGKIELALVPSIKSYIPNNLGLVIKSEVLLEFKQQLKDMVNSFTNHIRK